MCKSNMATTLWWGPQTTTGPNTRVSNYWAFTSLHITKNGPNKPKEQLRVTNPLGSTTQHLNLYEKGAKRNSFYLTFSSSLYLFILLYIHIYKYIKFEIMLVPLFYM